MSGERPLRAGLAKSARALAWAWVAIALLGWLPKAQASMNFPGKSPEDVWRAIRHQAHAIVEGRGGRDLYVFVDPNCPFCHTLFEQLQPLIGPRHLTIHWIVTGFLRASSAGKAAAILGARRPLSVLRRNEAAFRRGRRGGGIAPVPVRGRAARALIANNRLLGLTGPELVPTLVYRNQAGAVIIHQGVPMKPHGLLWTIHAIPWARGIHRH